MCLFLNGLEQAYSSSFLRWAFETFNGTGVLLMILWSLLTVTSSPISDTMDSNSISPSPCPSFYPRYLCFWELNVFYLSISFTALTLFLSKQLLMQQAIQHTTIMTKATMQLRASILNDLAFSSHTKYFMYFFSKSVYLTAPSLIQQSTQYALTCPGTYTAVTIRLFEFPSVWKV